MQKISKVLFFFIFICIFACSKDSVEPVDNSCGTTYSYTMDVKMIIDQSCAYSGCHDGVSSAPGNYTTFEGMTDVLTFGTFENRVIVAKNMPPFDAPGPKELTEAELKIIGEWLNAGFPKDVSPIAATYESSIQAIIDNSCAYSGCHDGGGIGDYGLYEGLESDINSGELFNRVVTLREDDVSGMPPVRAIDFGGPAMLTEEEFQLMLCWIENGYPEN
jgi:hypothetical protein